MPTKAELQHLQSQTLERKVRLTQTRIMEYYEKPNVTTVWHIRNHERQVIMMHFENWMKFYKKTEVRYKGE